MEEIMTEVEVNETQKYIDTINQLKANSVSKEQYDKLRDENKTLLESLVNGKTMESSSTEEASKPSARELSGKLTAMSKDGTPNLEFIATSLAYRDAYIDEFGKDPWALTGKDSQPTTQDYIEMEQQAQALKQLVEIADGNQEVFQREFTRVLTGSSMPTINPKLRK